MLEGAREGRELGRCENWERMDGLKGDFSGRMFIEMKIAANMGSKVEGMGDTEEGGSGRRGWGGFVGMSGGDASIGVQPCFFWVDLATLVHSE